MHSLPDLISDLALILIVAGFVTLLFKRLKQPLVLGYIVAGFLAGPHMPFTPTVQDAHSIETWSNIGVIFLMFTLGLEFSLKKIFAMGIRPILAASMVMGSMIGLGSMVGRLFGWASIDALFLGGMLAMSSTTIIYKAFDDLGLRQRKFAGEVLSVLILEDILGIMLMVLLSATAVSQQFEGGELVRSLFTLGFFLILWFVVGIYLIPLFLKKNRRFMNGETLLVVAIGLCFLLVVLADKAGYSAAFGAFMMGSILAETIEAETIERLVTPVKDLFGAIFFVSVGMLVDPQVLVDYWQAIAAITLTILVGQSVLGSSAFLVAGHPLRVAMHCGFSLAQIGEFAFIIAAMGVSLGVTSEFLYPVVVAVSIITTFLTPYMIKAANPAFLFVERQLPQRLRQIAHHKKNVTDSTSKPLSTPTEDIAHHPWRNYLRAIAIQTSVYAVLTVAATAISLSALLPLLRNMLTHWIGNAFTGMVTFMIIALFLRPIVVRKNNSVSTQVIRKRQLGRFLLGIVFCLRYALATYAVFYLIEYLSPYRWYYHLVAAILLIAWILRLRVVKYYSIRMERNFIHNLRQREVAARTRKGTAMVRRLEARDVHFARLVVPTYSQWGGRSLMELDFTQRDGVLVAAILRGDQRFNAPAGYSRIFPGDVLEVIADDENLEAFTLRMNSEVNLPPSADGIDHNLRLRRFVIPALSNWVGKSIAESEIRDIFHCTIVGFEESDGNISIATARDIIERSSVIWLVGEEHNLRAFNDSLTP